MPEARPSHARSLLLLPAALALLAAAHGAALPAAAQPFVPVGAPVLLSLPDVDAELRRQKLYDTETGALVIESEQLLGDGSVQPVDEATVLRLLRENAAAWRLRAGNISRSLYERLVEAAVDEPARLFPIGIAAPFDPATLPRGPRFEAVSGLPTDQDQAITDSHRAAVRNAVSPLVGRLETVVKAAGGADLHAASDVPLVFARMTAAQALALARNTANVGFVYDADDRQLLDLNKASCAIGSTTVTAAGVSADAVDVSIMEWTRPDNPSTCYDYITEYGEGSTPPDDATTAGQLHATWVAGTVASTLATLPGAAPEADILACDMGDVVLYAGGQIADGLAWSLDHGADVLNMSASTDDSGEIEAADWEMDWFIRHHRRLVVKSAGNTGAGNSCAGTNQVTNPSVGWNMLTVGNLDDQNSCDTSDDCIGMLGSSCDTGSCWIDPESPHGDREEPDLAAPGTNISTTNVNCGVAEVSGTSFSAPMTAGAVALLIARDNGVKHWPELARALLMATAWVDAEGASTSAPFRGEVGGVGGIDVAKADFALANDNHRAVVLEPADLDFYDRWLVTTISVEPTTTRLKVAIAWDSQPGSDSDLYSELMIQNDLDLFLRDNGTNELIAVSESYDDSYEVIDLVDPTPGAYQVWVQAFGPLASGSSAEYVGVAWHAERPCPGDLANTDGDTLCPADDNCPAVANEIQSDLDLDGVGDVCDNCVFAPNPGQEDLDGDASGDLCDPDDDNDGCEDECGTEQTDCFEDPDPTSPLEVSGSFLAVNCNPPNGSTYTAVAGDTDGDGTPDCADDDNDGDDVPDDRDPCPFLPDATALACQDVRSCGLQVWWDVCAFGGGCNELFAILVQSINPDPTTPVARFDRLEIVNQALYLLPSAGQSPEQAAGAFTLGAMSRASDAPGRADGLVLEIWQRESRTAPERKLVEVASFDPAEVMLGAFSLAGWLRVLPPIDPDKPVPLALSGVWTLGSDGAIPPIDPDMDGWPTFFDTCSALANPTQLDSNGDGVGNLCDADFDGDGRVGLPDFNRLRGGFGKLCGQRGYDADLDAEGNCAVGLSDFNLVRSQFGGAPGPSGQTCIPGQSCNAAR